MLWLPWRHRTCPVAVMLWDRACALIGPHHLPIPALPPPASDPNSRMKGLTRGHDADRCIWKLTKSRCARAFVCRVWIAVGFNADDPLDHSVDSRSGGRLFALGTRWPQTKRGQ